jgi:hypothetical protein
MNYRVLSMKEKKTTKYWQQVDLVTMKLKEFLNENGMKQD